MRDVWATYAGWMRDERGYAANTRQRYLLRAQAADRWLVTSGRPGVLWADPEALRAYYFSSNSKAANRNDIRSALIVFFDFTSAQGYRKDRENPARGLPRLKVGRRLPRPVPNEDIRRVLALAPAFGPMAEAMVTLFVYTGLRKSELRTLRWIDVEGEWLRVVGKGDKERSVPIPEVAREALARWRLVSTSPEYIFASTQRPGAPMSSTSLANLLRDLGECAHVPNLAPHQLRHTYGTALSEVADLRVVQEAMGHARPETTALYTQVRPGRLADAAHAISF